MFRLPTSRLFALPEPVRDRQAEWMDQAGLDPLEHRRALRGLARINAVSGSGRAILSELTKLARRLEPPRPLRILDLACGGGDVALDLARRAPRRGLSVVVTGIDRAAEAVALAREQAARAGLSNCLHFETADVLSDPWPRAPRTFGDTCSIKDDGRFDVVTCSLFLHHLDESDATRLLTRMAAEAAHLVLADDLERSRLGWAVAWVGTRLLSRSPIVHLDGPLSVRGAFTLAEAAELANRAGWRRIVVRRRFPFRYILSGEVSST